MEYKIKKLFLYTLIWIILIILDFSNYDSSKVENMEFNCMNNMSTFCEALASLDLNQFDTALFTSMKTMFLVIHIQYH